ncbi:unnamed protein product [Rotaria magnacalcarata]|uniref:F-box domain-containing protein n=5 Tax=Rotaria magnacalcarata TaxID=392030 RepID=A0A819PVS7_9BILA|nr:unnamed protein product [Rotaria magnacalcarata]CAF1685668.1 unnamed protein product [Rotaria magnacalcarata]CAF2089673.1 unnamed protein product [Rotaria magnacalcarata]CAF2092264.1 unnamed protein product [Rotaria magnacalcarata]CAF2147799.1 unnamed protein product [Rotaria magnacalcarata]
MVLSKFDDLPAELIVEISDYLDGCDLYYAFYGLSQRINSILDRQCHRLHVRFVRVPKIKFDLYCNRILPRISTRTVSLTLSGDNSSTPGQVALFLSRFNSLAHFFVKLESFKLIDYTKADVEILLPQFPMLTKLKRLSMGEYERLMPFSVDSNELFNENVILPISLRSLAFPYEVTNQWIQTLSTTTSFMIEQMHCHLIHMNVFFLLLQRFPNLKRLTAVITGINQDNLPMESIDCMLHGLRYLNINIAQQVVFDDFARVLRSLTQLHSLSIEALTPRVEFLEARRWETALPSNLSLFRFDLTMTLPVNPDHVELLEPFKSQFWVSRGWFVQCRLRDGGGFFRLSTVQSPIISILYWPDDEELLGSTVTAVYSNVTHVELWWNLSRTAHATCPNVRSIQFYGSGNDIEEPIQANILEMLQNPSFEHIIINDNIPINHTRFALILSKASDNMSILTCSGVWLTTMLEFQQYEWICLIAAMRLRKLIITDGYFIFSNTSLVAFCRTFINLREITMKIESKEDLFFLLNTLENLTMANITLPSTVFDDMTDYRKMIEENTILDNFVVRKQTTSTDICKLLLWIGSRHNLNPLRRSRDLYLKYWNINWHA